MTLYLDNNASTPVDKRVINEMFSTYKEFYGNAASRTHIYGQKALEVVEKNRLKVANLLGVEKNEVVFTSGATESDNIAILGLAKWGQQQGKKHIISTAIEHKAVLEPLVYLESQGFEVEYAPVNQSGRVEAIDVINRIRPDTLMVSIMHANNETGVIQPVQQIGEYLKDTETYFHVDAAQTYGKLVEELKALDYDLLSISGHKIYGPQGIGALIVRRRNYQKVPVKPITFGGGHESGLRPGTLPVALIAGLGKAAEIAGQEYKTRAQKCRETKSALLEQLTNVKCVVHGDQDLVMPHVINLSFIGIDSEALMLMLKNDLAFSNGSACTSKEYKPSHVLEAMGLTQELLDSAVRISWSHDNGQVDLSSLVSIVSSMQG